MSMLQKITENSIKKRTNSIKSIQGSLPVTFKRKTQWTTSSSETLSKKVRIEWWNRILFRQILKSFLIKGNDCVMQITSMNIKPTM